MCIYTYINKRHKEDIIIFEMMTLFRKKILNNLLVLKITNKQNKTDDLSSVLKIIIFDVLARYGKP